MKFLAHSFVLVLLLSGLALTANAQQNAIRAHDHSPYTKIDRAYQEGKLSLDQKILYKFYATNSAQKLPPKLKEESQLPIKCGTPAISDFIKNRDQLSASTIQKVKSMMGSSSMQASETYDSPDGNFTIHYETSGEHAVPAADENNNNTPDYVEEVATAADSSYRHEVQNLGYSDPIPPLGTYDVEIRNLSSYYGETRVPSPYGGESYIRIENDFSEGFPPNDDPEGDQLGAVKVTMAHEFKHAVQYEATKWQGESDRWAEMDATLMEEVVYDVVNDYYNYLDSNASIFNNPQSSFYPGSYYHVSWALYFEEKFGSQFWVNTWDTIKSNPQGVTLIEAITNELGGTSEYTANYIQSQLWHFASGSEKTVPNYGFEESASYPKPRISYNFTGEDSLNLPKNQTDLLQPLSAKYIEVTPSLFEGFVGIELTDVSIPAMGAGVIAYFKDGTTKQLLLPANGQNAISHKTNWAWQDLKKVGVVVANGSETKHTTYKIFVRNVYPDKIQLSQNYPNPFNNQTLIEYILPQRSSVKLEVYDILGRKVRSLVDENKNEGIHSEFFNTSDLASGIYFYRLQTDEKVKTKKMTIIK
ncbi:T9SS type A sorting domain-containing protein [Fodinibius halophilus]|uniref:T9SS type A sorting domain-containing protein n=1 Tax=Fodinibius halophilus TaxID=1736908 RepID=A0A6M1T5R7_9BACT|nr:T9SS type A sorting domain-containing protein [Fodinibius halophilus]NGP88615.1 T9SS type A sorting domain-containing protein [Fodinibius halophilus]